MKKIVALILVVILLIPRTTFAYYTEPTYPYDNKDRVTKVSKNINAKKWRINYRVIEGGSTRTYGLDNIESSVGKKGYIRYNKGRYYAIYKVGNKKKGYKYLIFSFEGVTIEDGWLVSKIPSKKKFIKKVKKGTTLKTVKNIDKDTYNIALYNEYTPAYESFHRFKDGTIAFVTYKKNKKRKWVVNKVEYEQDKMNVVKTLLKKDYKLIK